MVYIHIFYSGYMAFSVELSSFFLIVCFQLTAPLESEMKNKLVKMAAMLDWVKNNNNEMSTHPKQRVCSPVNGLTVCVSSVFFCTPACPVQMALSYLSLRCPRIFWLKDFSVLSSWVMGVQFVSSWSKKIPPKKQKRENKTKTQCYSGHHC